MIGFAVTERCPHCRMVLDTIAAPPGVGVLHRRNCHGRQCRKDGREPIYFMIRDGRARPLTADERAAMVAETGRSDAARRG